MLSILKLLCSILIISNRIAINKASNVDWCSIYSNKCQICTNQVISCNNINNTIEINNMTLSFGSQTRSITLTHFETFDSLNVTSSNLNSLVSLNLTSNNIDSIDDENASTLSLLLRQAPNLVKLNLANNSLRNTFQFDSPLLCSLKNLASLDLAQNHLEKLDYLKKCSLSHLTSLNLKSNKLKILSVTFLQKLSEWRASNRNFTVWLGGNEFRCNCVLLPFFKFLRANPSIVADVDTIKCSNESSWSTSLAFNRRVIDSNLDHICDHTTTTSTSNIPKIKSTWKWKTTNFSIIPVHYSRGHVNSRTLLIFVVCSFLFGCCVLLLVKPKCFCLKTKQQQQNLNHHHQQLQQDDDFGLGQTSSSSNRTLILADNDDQIPQKRFIYLFKSLKFTKIQLNINFIRQMWTKRPSSSLSSTTLETSNVAMRRLSEESLNFVDANPNLIYKKTSSTLKIKQISNESEDESEREEETIMDTIVRQDSNFKYKRIKRNNKNSTNSSEYGFHPNVFTPFS